MLSVNIQLLEVMFFIFLVQNSYSHLYVKNNNFRLLWESGQGGGVNQKTTTKKKKKKKKKKKIAHPAKIKNKIQKKKERKKEKERVSVKSEPVLVEGVMCPFSSGGISYTFPLPMTEPSAIRAPFFPFCSCGVPIEFGNGRLRSLDRLNSTMRWTLTQFPNLQEKKNKNNNNNKIKKQKKKQVIHNEIQ